MMNPLTLVGGFLLLFLAPGYFLLHALFPGRRYFGPFHPVALPLLSIVASTAILVVVGSILGFLPGAGPNGLGWFQGNQTGAPVIEIAMGAVSVVLFAIGWARGSYPLLGRERAYDDFIERGEPGEVTLLRDLRLEEERLRQEAIRIRKRAEESRDAGVRGALSEAADDLEKERRAVSARARQVEAQAGDRRYGAEAARSKAPLRRGAR